MRVRVCASVCARLSDMQLKVDSSDIKKIDLVNIQLCQEYTHVFFIVIYSVIGKKSAAKSSKLNFPIFEHRFLARASQ